jgi:hypothetical protein
MSPLHSIFGGTRNLLASFAILVAFCSYTPLFAQQIGEAFQATLTKASNVPGSSTIFMDLPVPAPGHRLTLKRVSVKVGAAVSIYTQVHNCYIESDRPKIPNVEYLQARTRVHLSAPEYFTYSGDRFWYIRDAATLIYYDNVIGVGRSMFRLTCEGDAMGSTMPLSVTVVGYTTPLP